MQNFAPLQGEFDLVGVCSRGNNFDLKEISFPVRQLWSWGQFLRPRIIRQGIQTIAGDYHDLQGLKTVLRGCDIVHTAEPMYYCSYQAAQAKRECGYRLVVTVWENIPFNYNIPATRRLKERVFREADLFLAVTQRARDVLILEGAPAEKVTVQMPGIDINHFRPQSKDHDLLRRFGCEDTDIIVLFVANLYREKGVFDLLYAFKSCILSGAVQQPTKLLFGGTGPQAGRLREAVAQLGLEKHVRFIGSHPYSRMPSIHNLADVFVLPSQPASRWQEQFGYVLVESMACGKPVVTTQSGSIPEVVADAGTVVPSNDYIALARAIIALLQAKELRRELGARGRKRAETTFNAAKVAQQLRHHYSSLFTPPGTHG
jgi:glycosyltransferase involved in cell wall biosynthesis